MGAEAVVFSFLFSLLLSMGLIGGSYQDIANAFPENTAQQNQILYSVANDPTQNTGGFLMDYLTDPNMIALTNPYLNYALSNPSVADDWNSLMQELGFAIVGNNVNVAIDNGLNISGNLDTLNIELVDGTVSTIKYVGYISADSPSFVSEYLPDYVTYGYPSIAAYLCPVFMTTYHNQILYHTSFHTAHYNASKLYIYVNRGGSMPVFSVENDVAYCLWDEYGGSISKDNINGAWYYYLGWEGVNIDAAETVEGVGEEYLSFGDVNNPVIGVEYDPSTGVTTYKYKDGSISTTPPVAMSDTIALSPSIAQPLTQYIVNEGDVTNIFNPDAAIPSDSSIPFDFTSLGQLLNQTFIPSIAFPYQTIYNRLLNKATFLTVITDISVRLKNITPRRPEYFIYGVDMFEWIDTIGQTNFVKVKNLIAFALKVSMLLGSIALVMKTFHVNVGKGGET